MTSLNASTRIGTGLAVHLQLENGELCASFGIEGYAEVRTEAPEFCEIERNADGSTTCPAHLVFALLGSSLPVFVERGQLVTVFHSGLDLFVLDGAVPALSCAPALCDAANG